MIDEVVLKGTLPCLDIQTSGTVELPRGLTRLFVEVLIENVMPTIEQPIDSQLLNPLTQSWQCPTLNGYAGPGMVLFQPKTRTREAEGML